MAGPPCFTSASADPFKSAVTWAPGVTAPADPSKPAVTWAPGVIAPPDDDDAFFQQPPRKPCKSFSVAAQRGSRLPGEGPAREGFPPAPRILSLLAEEGEASRPRRRWSLDRASFLGMLPPVLRVHDINQVRMKRLIGAGGFGSVYLGQFRGRTVAVKKMHRCVKNIKAKVESFRAECSVQHLRHPNIVQVLASSVGDPATKDAWLVMEYAGERDLQHVINDPSELLDFRRRLRYALDIISALRYIHERRVIHLDLKPANVIITPQDYCKLGDFGCCQTVVDDSGLVSPTRRSYLTGTFAYRAPELLRGDPPTAKADIYSFGVTLWHMLSRETPYAGQNQHVVMYGVVAYGVRPRVPAAPSGGDGDGGNPVMLPCGRFSSSSSSGSCSTPGYATAEEYYRDLYVHCWDADPEARQPASDLADLVENWSESIF